MTAFMALFCSGQVTININKLKIDMQKASIEEIIEKNEILAKKEIEIN